MSQIGIRELKIHASEIMRRVREEQVRYVVTYRGRPVGVILPITEAEVESGLPKTPPAVDPWDELMALGKQIGEGWQSPQTSAEILSDMRR